MKKKLTTYNEVAIEAKLTEDVSRRFIAYMKQRWGEIEDEKLKCLTGYAMEWAIRFKYGIEYSSSDNIGKIALHHIDYECYHEEVY